MRKKYSLALLSLLFALGVVQTLANAAGEQSSDPPLYKRLGGIYPIASVVDDFVERLLVNDTLNANPAIDAARHTVPKPGLKYLVTAFVAKATGGPEQYAGRTMKASHADLNITNEEWAASMVDFDATLDKFEVPDKERMELIALLESTKGDIVTKVD